LACLETLLGSVSVVGSASLGSSLSIRNWARLESGLPVDLRVNFGEAASIRSLARLGSSLPFSASCLDSWVSVEPRCRSEAIFALDVHYLLRRLVAVMGSLSGIVVARFFARWVGGAISAAEGSETDQSEIAFDFAIGLVAELWGALAASRL
jgi:hypothetical protein